MNELKDKDLFAAIRVVVKNNFPDKYLSLLECEKKWGEIATTYEYEMWVEENIPLDSMRAAAVYSALYEKNIDDVIELMESRVPTC